MRGAAIVACFAFVEHARAEPWARTVNLKDPNKQYREWITNDEDWPVKVWWKFQGLGDENEKFCDTLAPDGVTEKMQLELGSSHLVCAEYDHSLPNQYSSTDKKRRCKKPPTVDNARKESVIWVSDILHTEGVECRNAAVYDIPTYTRPPTKESDLVFDWIDETYKTKLILENNDMTEQKEIEPFEDQEFNDFRSAKRARMSRGFRGEGSKKQPLDDDFLQFKLSAVAKLGDFGDSFPSLVLVATAFTFAILGCRKGAFCGCFGFERTYVPSLKPMWHMKEPLAF